MLNQTKPALYCLDDDVHQLLPLPMIVLSYSWMTFNLFYTTDITDRIYNRIYIYTERLLVELVICSSHHKLSFILSEISESKILMLLCIAMALSSDV